MLTVVNCVQQDWDSIKALCLDVELEQSRATHMHFTACFCDSRESYPCPLTWHGETLCYCQPSWLGCPANNKIITLWFNGKVVWWPHWYDIPSDWQELPKWFSVGAAPGQNLSGLLADSGFAAWNWSSCCCRSPESKYCNPGGCSGY